MGRPGMAQRLVGTQVSLIRGGLSLTLTRRGQGVCVLLTLPDLQATVIPHRTRAARAELRLRVVLLRSGPSAAATGPVR